MIDLVLISGQQGSGKTTTAAAIEVEAKRLGYSKVFKLNFADPLYTLHDFILNKMESAYAIKRTTDKDGVLLQMLGTDWGRLVHGPDIWAQILKNRMDKEVYTHYNDGTKILFLVADCRFENEFNFFGEALRVRLRCPEDVRKNRTHSWRQNTAHPSETGLSDYDMLGKFDLYIDTNSAVDPEGCASLVLAQLQKRNWIQKREEAKLHFVPNYLNEERFGKANE